MVKVGICYRIEADKQRARRSEHVVVIQETQAFLITLLNGQEVVL